MSTLTFILPLVIFGLMVMVGVAIAVNQNERRVFRCATGDEPFTVLSVPQAFDPDYAIIWGTQIPALELVVNAGASGLPVRQLLCWYEDSARHYPELYDGSNFARWIEFFEREQLLRADQGTVLITTAGRQFLQCRVTAPVLVS